MPDLPPRGARRRAQAPMRCAAISRDVVVHVDARTRLLYAREDAVAPRYDDDARLFTLNHYAYACFAIFARLISFHVYA